MGNKFFWGHEGARQRNFSVESGRKVPRVSESMQAEKGERIIHCWLKFFFEETTLEKKESPFEKRKN